MEIRLVRIGLIHIQRQIQEVFLILLTWLAGYVQNFC